MEKKMEQAREALLKYFGYDSFRQGQERLIGDVLTGRDVLGVMPTGAGKSICYQVPALVMGGITIVISPLISLMKDQVTALIAAGVKAAYINSSLTEAQQRTAMKNAREGMYKIIYVAPERLEQPGFAAFCAQMDVSLFAVDEAHCVSQWGHDFRPAYLKITEAVHRFKKRPVVCAFTATATREVKEDIVSLLELNNPQTVATGFDRENLYFDVIKNQNKDKALLQLVAKERGKSGIVYCATRKSVEDVCALLHAKGYAATRYHAGLDEAERAGNQEDFLYDRKTVMVATNAFGMGIDKPNVGFVFHYNMPKNMESYYQEAGRAGRDGSPANCVMLYNAKDVQVNRYFIENNSQEEELDREEMERIKERDYGNLKIIQSYCMGSGCYRAAILRYFGETVAGFCGNCGNCNGDFTEKDVTDIAQKIAQYFVWALKEHPMGFGRRALEQALMGKATKSVSKFGLIAHESFGLCKAFSKQMTEDIVSEMIARDCLGVSAGAYPVLQTTEYTQDLLDGKITIQLKMREEELPPIQKGVPSLPVSENLFDRLRKLRKEIAESMGVPAYVVFTDAALRDMSSKIPRTNSELLAVSGVGQAKAKRFGRRFLEEIADYLGEETLAEEKENHQPSADMAFRQERDDYF